MNAITTTAASKSVDATFYTFRFVLEWKGVAKEVVIKSLGIEDAGEFFHSNARAISGLPRSSLVRNIYVSKETPEDRAARSELSPVAARLVAIARGEA